MRKYTKKTTNDYAHTTKSTPLFNAESIKTTHFLPKVDFVRLYLILRLGKKRIDFLLLLSAFYYFDLKVEDTHARK